MKKKSTTTPQPKTGEARLRTDEKKSTDQKDTAKPLDFSSLDLTIDRVDERLSPSETNIFDK